ncbi:unnamed protein product [Euphydryas editha]|uniref:Transposase Tc1-like domain-containing protein n=1 Tax=Euphydryas editha TaxID=104508 RepID=A0AAU9TXY9_EUPED|nr:unnamed protein product [Euphydryas editha]
MKWGDKENRIAVIALHKVGMELSVIFQTHQKLGFIRMFVYRTINRNNNTWSVEDQKRSGRPRAVRTTKPVNAVKVRIHQNPIRNQKILSREMKIPARTLSRIIKQDLKLGAYRRYRYTCSKSIFTIKESGSIKTPSVTIRR